MRAKVLIAACIATAIFVVGVGTATATKLAITNAEKGFRIAWERFSVAYGLGGAECQLTLKGRFEVASFPKTAGTSLGVVDRAIVGTCAAGGMTALAETLPWSVQYSSFGGTLPNISSIGFNVVGLALRLGGGGPSCLIQTTNRIPLRATGTLSELEAMTSVVAEYSNGPTLSCESTVQLEAAGRVTVLAEASAPTFRLIAGESFPAPVAPFLSGSRLGEFGRLEVEGVAKRVITINAGTEAITVQSVRVRSGNYFAITDPNRCVGSRIAVNGRCSFNAVFTAPAEAGRSVEDQLSVEAGLTPVDLTLRGST